MIICHHCRSQQLDGTLFCSECGASLISSSRPTSVPSPRPLPTPTPLIADRSDAPHLAVLVLVVADSGRRMILTVQDDLLIGRRDEKRGIVPDVDLEDDGGYDAGVSRRHAILSYKDGTYRVEDLGSANGTFINSRQLAPHLAVVLTHGDELKCGMIAMRVELS